eukprot:72952-Alexandrium_andersonii.AAC.1
MSASLVGSEMCIRDRSQTCKSAANCLKLLPAVSSPFQEFRRPTDPQQPVSYTHLTLPTICSV